MTIDTWRRHGWKAALATAIVAAIALSLLRGAWLDEGYSFWFAGHDVGFGEALRMRWMRDAHPPLYYAWLWLVEPWLGGSIQTLRFANLAVLLVPAATWRAARGIAVNARFHRLFAMLVAASPFFVLYAAELRSYFVMYVLAAALVAQLKLVEEAGAAPPARLFALIAVTVLLLFDVHYLGGLVAGVPVGLAALDRLARRDWRTATWLIVPGAIGVVAVGATAAYYLARAVPGTPHDVSEARAAIAIAGFLGLALVTAPVALLVAIRGARPLRAALRDRFAVGAAAASALLVAGFLAYNITQHNLLARYVIGAVPVVLALVAALAARGCERWTWGEPAIAAGAIVATLGATASGLANKRWETNAPAIAALAQQCPTTRVLSPSATLFMPADAPMHAIPGIRDAFRLTYETIAQRHGYRVDVIDGPATPLMMDARCPTILWVEHRFFAPMYDDRRLIAAAELVSPTGRIAIRERREGDGRLLLVLAAAPADK